VSRLSLEHLRPEATVLTCLKGIAEDRGYQVVCQPTAVSVEMDLPDTWEEYLGLLATKERHEVNRKLRNLYQAGRVAYRQVAGGDITGDIIDRFLELFSLSRDDKAAFMTARMEQFFRSVAGAMGTLRLLRFGILEMDALPVAMVMAFDYRDMIYLYNSAYDPQYQKLSVGLLSKVLCIRESIRAGRQRFDFMKGNETYKYHLGGRKVPLYSCRIDIERS
jgi:CelD/BcsL family acetyltransferase involved in cellulose biosynthesis